MSFSRLLQWLSAVLLVALFALAAFARFRLPLTPLADPDIWCYVNPGLSKLLGEGFQHTYGQCFLYPGLIYVMLATCGDWRAITVVQHLGGLGTGALLLVAWRQVRGLLPTPRVPRFLFDLAGLAMAGVYLFSLSPIRFEHTLRPEAVFPFFAVLNICCNLAFIRHRFYAGKDRTRRPGLDWWGLATGAGAVFACVTAFLLKPSFSALLLLANVPVGLSLFLGGSSRRDKLTLALVSVLAPGLLLLLPESLLRRGDPDAHAFLAVSLFTVHAGLIRDQMATELAQHRTAPYDPAFLGTVQARLAEEIQISAGERPYASLGYNPDYLKLRTSFNGWLTKQFDHPEQVANFYDDYYRRTWRGRPLAMVGKIWRQLRVFYRVGACPAYQREDRLDLRDGYTESATIFDPGPRHDSSRPSRTSNLFKVERYGPGRAYVAQCEGLAPRSLVLTNSPWADVAARELSPTYLPLCGWALLLGLAAWALPPVRLWAGGTAGVLLLLYADNFGTTLSLSIGHSMDVGRYSVYQLAYTLLPQSVSALLAVEAALAAGAFLVARYGPWFAARPEALPAPVVPTARELSVGLLVSGERPNPGQAPWVERCQQAFPGARLHAGNAVDGWEDGDVWLALAGEPPDADPADAARRLLHAYAAAPADLITVRGTKSSGVFAWFARWAVGADLGAGGRLLSERLRRSVPAASSAWETAALAAGRGFLTREIPPPETIASPVGSDAPGSWRQAGRLFAVCCQCRPLRVLGATAGVCLLLAVGIGGTSLHHPPHARHRWVVRRGPLVAAGALSVAALASLAAGGVLEVRRRRWRAAFGHGQTAARCVATSA